MTKEGDSNMEQGTVCALNKSFVFVQTDLGVFAAPACKAGPFIYSSEWALKERRPVSSPVKTDA